MPASAASWCGWCATRGCPSRSTTLTSALGGGLFFLFAAAAPLFGAFYGEPAVVPIIRVLAVSFLLAAPESVYSALLIREMRFGLLGARRIAATLSGGAAGIAAAVGGLGVWALVIHSLVTAAAGSALLAWRSPWRPRWEFSRKAARELWGFGRWVTGSRLLNHLNRNADNLLIGRFLGAAALGLYSFSYQAVLLPLLVVARPVSAVSFPSFARLQHDRPRCAKAYLDTLEMVTVVAWPVAALAAFAAPAAIPIVVGTQWQAAIPIFQVLSGVAALHSFMNLSAPLFDGLGRPEWGFRWTGFVLTLNLIGFAVGLRWGSLGVAVGLFVATCFQLPVQWLVLRRLLPLPFGRLVSLFARAVLLFAGVGTAWHAWAAWFEPVRGWLPLIACGLATGLVSIALPALLFPNAVVSVQRMVRSLRRGEPPALAEPG